MGKSLVSCFFLRHSVEFYTAIKIAVTSVCNAGGWAKPQDARCNDVLGKCDDTTGTLLVPWACHF